MLPRIEPAKLAIACDVFNHPNWAYELKYDGFRALTYISKGKAWMVSKKGFTYKRFDDLCHHVAWALKECADTILDGEIVCLDAQGRPRFYDLMFRRGEPCLALFDILWKEARTYANCRCYCGRRCFARLSLPKILTCFTSMILTTVTGLYDLVCQQDLEGVIMKPKESPYASNSWLKIRNPDYSQTAKREEFSNRK